MRYERLIINGIVQGVGFRPFVVRIARASGLFGFVRNDSGLVVCEIAGQQNVIETFIEMLKTQLPANAVIETLERVEIAPFISTSFEIERSKNTEIRKLPLILPDIGICNDCISEVRNPADRRFKHAFNSCVACGPRYTIVQSLPYDRETTTMRDFNMCNDCKAEYTAQDNHRFHAQTVSCHACPPNLSFENSSGKFSGQSAVENAIADLANGGIVAIKGIGGFHLACLPSNKIAVDSLRRLKNRELKPLAVMFKDVDMVKSLCEVSDAEETLLSSSAKPIVLLKRHRDEEFYKSIVTEVAADSLELGCFLPYTAVQVLLLDKLNALVMTSANLSSRPIITDESELAHLKPHLAGVLTHNRKILRQADDSVARVIDEKPQLIRRARGYCPLPLTTTAVAKRPILALGGDLKATFAIMSKNKIMQSPYFGDLDDLDCLERFEHTISDYLQLFNITPCAVAVDTHPLYNSRNVGINLAKKLKLPIFEVQHHHAHIASVIAEHKLTTAVIGVAFDGTGYGDDGTVWGGEFFLCDKENVQRMGHMAYTDIIGGDESMRDAMKTACCYLYAAGLSEFSNFDSRAENILAAIKTKINTVKTSSVGRLFDAVAAIIGVATANRYEGECGISLENMATLAVENSIDGAHFEIDVHDNSGILELNPLPMLVQMYHSTQDKQAKALGFHIALCNAICETCRKISEKTGVATVCLSGGVFQNKLLLEMTKSALKMAKFDVYFNQQTPTNDGGISLGQAFIVANKIRNELA